MDETGNSCIEKYYKTKASYLGYKDGLPWYEIYAPLVDIPHEYSYEKGCDFVVQQFSSFSKKA